MTIKPMLAKAAEMPEGPDWVYEPKVDGLRCAAYIRGGAVSLVSRSGKAITAFPDIEEALAGLPDCILDGEVCVVDAAGTTQFNLLQQRMNIKDEGKMQERTKEFPTVYYAFDLLELNGRSTLDAPLQERKSLLAKLFGHPALGEQAQYVVHYWHGRALLDAVKRAGGEGVVAKNLRDPYKPSNRSAWIKVKFRESDEFVVVGWIDGEGRREGGIGALLVATPSDTDFHYVTKVGTGFDDCCLAQLTALLAPLSVTDCPVDNPPKGNIHWIKPNALVVEIEFQLRTRSGSLRHPVFKGIRIDKTVADL